MMPIMRSSRAPVIHLLIFILVSVTLLLFSKMSVFSSDLSDVSALQCSGGIISIGDMEYHVLKKCGEPTTKTGDGNVWIYDLGSSELVRYVAFVGDKVHRIQLGGYGGR